MNKIILLILIFSPLGIFAQKNVVKKPCLKVLDQMFIYVDGQVTLCCWDSAERAIVGDSKIENTLKIWNGPILARYRDLLSNGDREKILLCSRCDAYENLDFSKITMSHNQTQPYSQVEGPLSI